MSFRRCCFVLSSLLSCRAVVASCLRCALLPSLCLLPLLAARGSVVFVAVVAAASALLWRAWGWFGVPFSPAFGRARGSVSSGAWPGLAVPPPAPFGRASWASPGPSYSMRTVAVGSTVGYLLPLPFRALPSQRAFTQTYHGFVSFAVALVPDALLFTGSAAELALPAMHSSCGSRSSAPQFPFLRLHAGPSFIIVTGSH